MNVLSNTQATVPTEAYGQRIDIVLAKLFPDFSRSQLTQWLKQGLITVNQQVMKPKEKVFGGEIIHLQVTLETMQHPEHTLPEDIPLKLAYEDEHLLIVNKPAGLVVHPGAGNASHTLVNALLHYQPTLAQLPRAGIIHRLDKDTTGLLLVAKTLPTYTHLTRMMQAREIHRQYLALVYGHIIAGDRIETGYGRHPRNRLKKAVCPQGKVAITDYRIKRAYHDFSLIEVTLLTGRTHQIRVHMAHIKHPVLGDPLYGHPRLRIPAGASDALRDSLQQLKRQALHAWKLSFIHPQTEQEILVEAPFPEDFSALLNLLEQHVQAS